MGDKSSAGGHWPSSPQNTQKSDKTPDLDHFILESVGTSPLIFTAGTRPLHPPPRFRRPWLKRLMLFRCMCVSLDEAMIMSSVGRDETVQIAAPGPRPVSAPPLPSCTALLPRGRLTTGSHHGFSSLLLLLQLPPMLCWLQRPAPSRCCHHCSSSSGGPCRPDLSVRPLTARLSVCPRLTGAAAAGRWTAGCAASCAASTAFRASPTSTRTTCTIT